MALAPFTGNLRDFTGGAIDGVRMWVHPLRSVSNGSTVFADAPVEIPVDSSGGFSKSLEERQQYRLEIIFSDPERSRTGMSILGEFRMPVGGGNAGDIIGIPVANGMVRVIQGPPTDSMLDQYLYDEFTGDLYERTA